MARNYSARRRVMVTGGAGFLGSHLCERLLADAIALHGEDPDFVTALARGLVTAAMTVAGAGVTLAVHERTKLATGRYSGPDYFTLD